MLVLTSTSRRRSGTPGCAWRAAEAFRSPIARSRRRLAVRAGRGRGSLARLAVLAAICAAMAAGCRGAADPRPAALIVAYPQGLVEVGLDGASPHTIVPGSRTATPRNPAVSPDGRRIAYVETPQPGAADTGADLWLSDRDGGHRRVIVRHPAADRSLRWPRWQDDGHILVVMDVPATCDGCNPQTTTQQDLERVDVATGSMTLVRQVVLEFDVAPDGAGLVFPDAGHEKAEGLQTAAIDGAADAHEVVPLDRRFAQITSPRFSPDGERIAFAAAAAGALAADQPFVTRAAFAPLTGPSSDGGPANIWLVGADGDGLRLLAALRESAPSLAWDPDGAAIYVVGAAALYRIDAGTGVVTRIGPGASGATLAYAPPER